MPYIPSGQRLIGANFLLQQDNDPKHTSKLRKNYLGKMHSASILSVMEWPAQSPDLNPIELLWEQLDRMVRKKCPSSQFNLWEVNQEAWGEISSYYLNTVTARMPNVQSIVLFDSFVQFKDMGNNTKKNIEIPVNITIQRFHLPDWKTASENKLQ